ncbi:hypothetical protein [Pantoea stewartii]|uniref:hypothetical protein n=1 Tax=Pantoea stewartii TaxID=66269 RepID=UPI00197DD9F0|nr:hypothetical protein [Pantoea stewartii]
MASIKEFKFKRTKVAGRVPDTTTIQEGEIAINLKDKRIYSRDGDDIVELGGINGSVTGNIDVEGTIKAGGLNIKNALGTEFGGTGADNITDARINLDVYSKTETDTKFVPKTTKVNGYALSSDINLNKDDVGLTNVTNEAQLVVSKNLSDIPNATTARYNISAAKNGANDDITSLSGLTTALSISQGGTGSNTKEQAAINLNVLPLTGGTVSGNVKVTGQIMGGDQSTITNNLVVKGLNAGAGQSLSLKDYQGNENVSLYTANTDGFLNIRVKGKRIVTDSNSFKMELAGLWNSNNGAGTSYGSQWTAVSPVHVNHGDVDAASNYYSIIKGITTSKNNGWSTRMEMGMLRDNIADWGKGNIIVGAAEGGSAANKFSVYTFDINGNFSSPNTVSSPSIIGNYLRAKNAVDIYPETDPAFSSGSTYNSPEFRTGWNTRGAVSGGVSKGYASFYGQEEVGKAWRAAISVVGYSNKNPIWLFNETGTTVLPGELRINSQDYLRTIDGATGTALLHRYDGNDYYLLFSDSTTGTWNDKRPFRVTRSSGRIGMAHGLSVSNGVSVDSGNLNVGQAFMQNDGNIYGSVYGGYIRDWVQNNAINVANDARDNRVTTCRRGGRQEQYQGEAYSWEVRNGYLTGTSNTTGDGNVRFTTWFYRVPMFYIPSRGWVEFENG